MRTVTLIFSLCFIAFNCSAPSAADTQDHIRVAAEDATKAAAPSLRTCSANSADRTQSCNVTCPEGKTATCTGGAQGAPDVDCTCK
jgi:hypothetical protein